MTLVPRNTCRLFPLLLLALATTSAQAADSYLKVIPASALAWGAVNHMNEASDKIQKLATVVQAPAVSALDEAKKEWGVTKGLDEKGAAGFFVVPGKTEKDPVATAIFVAVTDQKEFLANFEVVKAGEAISEIKPKQEEDKPAIPGVKGIPNLETHRMTATSCLAFRGGYALLSPKRDRAALEAAVEAKQDIAAEMTGMESWLAENDGVVVGMAAGIKLACKQASETLKTSKENIGGGAEAAVVRSVLDLYGKIPETAATDVSLAVAGIRCDKQGSIHVIGRARLVSGGMVSKAMASIPSGGEKLLSGVPGGPFIIAASGVSVSSLMGNYNMLTGFMKGAKSLYGMSDEDAERMSKESAAALGQVRSMNIVMKTGKRGDPVYSNIYSVMHVDNSKKLLDLQEKYAENVNKLMQNAKQGMIKSMSAQRLEIAGQPALQQEMNFDFSNLPGAEATRPAMDAMFGLGGKMLIYYVAADEHTVLMGMGVPQERMAAALDILKQPKKSLAEDADVAVTAAMLPADSQWVAYLSLRGYVQMTQRLMSATLKSTPGMEDFTLPQFAKAPPIGLAVTATPAELRAEIAVPSSVVQATGDYIKEMQEAVMKRMMQQNQPAPPAP